MEIFESVIDKYLTALVYIPGRAYPLKYRNIKNCSFSKNRFLYAMQLKWQTVDHVNYYGKDSKQFIEQQKNIL